LWPFRGSLWGMVPELILTSGLSQTLVLSRVQDGRPARWKTQVEVGRVGSSLMVRFHCHDEDIWATMTERDQPLWDEEVIEVFLAPGQADPTLYYEFEVNPLGTLWDGKVTSPNLRREGMASHPEWDCTGLTWSAWTDESQQSWGGELLIPLNELSGPVIPPVWRMNLYRIERPQAGGTEYQAWSPTLVAPVDFHVPSRFGLIRFL
jgi:hypothetical protein